MEKITAKTRPVFLLFFLGLFFLLFFSSSLFKHVAINGLAMNPAGLEKAAWTVIFSAITIFFMVKFPFLRLNLAKKESGELVYSLRYAEIALFVFIFVLLPYLITDLLPKGVRQLLPLELSIVGAAAGIILIIEIFIIPAARNSQKTRESLKEKLAETRG